MQFTRFRGGRALPVLVGTLVGLGALAASVSPAAAKTNHPAVAHGPAVVSPEDETSIFIAYPDKNHDGTPQDINGCGTHNMPFAVGSYEWINRGQSALLYNTKNASGAPVATLAQDQAASSSNPVGWKSIFIVC